MMRMNDDKYAVTEAPNHNNVKNHSEDMQD